VDAEIVDGVALRLDRVALDVAGLGDDAGDGVEGRGHRLSPWAETGFRGGSEAPGCAVGSPSGRRAKPRCSYNEEGKRVQCRSVGWFTGYQTAGLGSCRKVRIGHHDFPRQPQLFQQADRQIGAVELPPAVTVLGGARIGVMVVVPALAVAEDSDKEIVAAALVGGIVAIAPEMGDRVDRPGLV